jgi:hypothetical protein
VTGSDLAAVVSEKTRMGAVSWARQAADAMLFTRPRLLVSCAQGVSLVVFGVLSWTTRPASRERQGLGQRQRLAHPHPQLLTQRDRLRAAPEAVGAGKGPGTCSGPPGAVLSAPGSVCGGLRPLTLLTRQQPGLHCQQRLQQ